MATSNIDEICEQVATINKKRRKTFSICVVICTLWIILTYVVFIISGLNLKSVGITLSIITLIVFCVMDFRYSKQSLNSTKYATLILLQMYIDEVVQKNIPTHEKIIEIEEWLSSEEIKGNIGRYERDTYGFIVLLSDIYTYRVSIKNEI